MARFLLRLHDGQKTTPVVEPLDADDAEQAKVLAEIRLLLTNDYTHAHIYEGDRQVAELNRFRQGPNPQG
ncbi:hypothetical protein IWC96_08530 [Brevundimonas sp. BAL450]|uniref:hypothetical protein n=1 Tax=Brevundimonas sp. BAL450 TaxID=1708162 RepID=UPI0018CB7A6B|nr:hypothetical protein [Brevundimonas sp. BAL450]MBG7615327.1 hypothetical protein [Brevundimonas sp. BAL450]